MRKKECTSWKSANGALIMILLFLEIMGNMRGNYMKYEHLTSMLWYVMYQGFLLTIFEGGSLFSGTLLTDGGSISREQDISLKEWMYCKILA